MKKLIKKGLVIGIILLFATVYIGPGIAEENITEINNEEKITIDCNSINIDGSSFNEEYILTEEEFSNLKSNLAVIFETLKSKNDEKEIMDFLNSFLSSNDNSLLNKIISYLLNNEILGNRKLVLSLGWGYNLNPFKSSKTDIIRPITFWQYSGTSNQMLIPSTTGILSLNPFEIKTLNGAQMGFMLRFRGLYIHMAKSISQQSFTCFIGSARFAGGFEFSPLSSIF